MLWPIHIGSTPGGASGSSYTALAAIDYRDETPQSITGNVTLGGVSHLITLNSGTLDITANGLVVARTSSGSTFATFDVQALGLDAQTMGRFVLQLNLGGVGFGQASDRLRFEMTDTSGGSATSLIGINYKRDGSNYGWQALRTPTVTLADGSPGAVASGRVHLELRHAGGHLQLFFVEGLGDGLPTLAQMDAGHVAQHGNLATLEAAGTDRTEQYLGIGFQTYGTTSSSVTIERLWALAATPE